MARQRRQTDATQKAELAPARDVARKLWRLGVATCDRSPSLQPASVEPQRIGRPNGGICQDPLLVYHARTLSTPGVLPQGIAMQERVWQNGPIQGS